MQHILTSLSLPLPSIHPKQRRLPNDQKEKRKLQWSPIGGGCACSEKVLLSHRASLRKGEGWSYESVASVYACICLLKEVYQCMCSLENYTAYIDHFLSLTFVRRALRFRWFFTRTYMSSTLMCVCKCQFYFCFFGLAHSRYFYIE